MVFTWAPAASGLDSQKNAHARRIHRYLYDGGFRQVLCSPVGCEDSVLLVFKPHWSPNYLHGTSCQQCALDKTAVDNFLKDVSRLCGDTDRERTERTRKGEVETERTRKGEVEFPLPDCSRDIAVKNDLPWLLPEQTSHWPGQVIVVGGGIAGLVAAVALAEAGKHVVLLEASNYIGESRCTR